jgi:hypothetical protein
VINTLDESLFKTHDADLSNIYAKPYIDYYYEPFLGWIHLWRTPLADTKVELSEFETYTYNDGSWTVELYEFRRFPHTKGFILKSIEVKMREAMGFAPIKPPVTKLLNRELKDGRRSWTVVSDWRRAIFLLLKNKIFNKTIGDAIAAFGLRERMDAAGCGKAKQDEFPDELNEAAQIEIDMSRLDRIWDDHIKTAAMLNTDDSFEYVEAPSSDDELCANDDDAHSDDFGIRSDDCDEIYSDGFVGLLSRFTKTEYSLICSLLHGRSNSLPTDRLELIVEDINEKALDTISDNLIEYADGRYSIFEEYQNELLCASEGIPQ